MFFLHCKIFYMNCNLILRCYIIFAFDFALYLKWIITIIEKIDIIIKGEKCNLFNKIKKSLLKKASSKAETLTAQMLTA